MGPPTQCHGTSYEIASNVTAALYDKKTGKFRKTGTDKAKFILGQNMVGG
jgi:hypothetical protein